jgi:peptidoglycan/xylan/chitin deacetylase (PgdA/CDA1 family)
MSRALLPQNYIVNNGGLLEGFENIGDWTASGPGGRIEADPVNFRSGNSSLKLVVTTSGGYIRATKIISYRNNGNRLFRFWVYHYGSEVGAEVRIYLSSVSDLSKSFNKAITNLRPGWNLIVIHRDEFNVTGGESWDNTMIRLQFRHYAVEGTTSSMSIDELRCGVEAMPRCVIGFDDGGVTGYTEGYSYMHGNSLNGTIYIITNFVGHTDMMTISQLHEMYNAGWAISNHTSDHTALAGHAAEEVAEKILDGQNYLLSNGFDRSARHLAYPSGSYDDTVVAITHELTATARTVDGAYQPAPVVDYHLIYGKVIGKKNSLAEAKNYVDTAIMRGCTVVLGFHHIVTAANDNTEWSIDNFRALINYIIAKKIKCVSIDEWYNGLADPRYQSLTQTRSMAESRMPAANRSMA